MRWERRRCTGRIGAIALAFGAHGRLAFAEWTVAHYAEDVVSIGGGEGSNPSRRRLICLLEPGDNEPHVFDLLDGLL